MAYLNVYQSGYYHRRGKPGQFNCHPGDLYPSREAAENDIDPAARHLYLGTFPVDIPAELLGDCNPMDSVPTPLSVTKRQMRREAEVAAFELDALPVRRLPSHIEGMRPLRDPDGWTAVGSLETTEAEAIVLSTEEIIGRWGTGEQGR